MVTKTAGLEVLKQLGLLALGRQSACQETVYSGRHGIPKRFPLYTYAPPDLRTPFADNLSVPPTWSELPPDASMADILEATRLLVFIGCEDSPEFLGVLDDQTRLKIVCEPDIDRLGDYVASKGPRSFVRRNVLFLGGDPDKFTPSAPIPSEIFRFGFPVVLADTGLFQACPQLVEKYARQVEIAHYRKAIYPLESQEFQRGRPIRPMRRDAIYDRIAHLYENILLDAQEAGSINDLQDALSGETAILVAAGPALDEKLDWLQANRNRAVVIAVNNAMRTLLAHGVEPDFCVINDTSLSAGKAFEGLPRLQKCRLVAHCMSKVPSNIFPRIYFFGNVEGQLSPKRDSLRLHGSVITTAFSLAEYLGCRRVVLTGAQLASDDPDALSYSKDSIHGPRLLPEAEHGKKTKLVPTTAANGSLMFTNLNFLDVAYWFLDRIRTANLEVVQTAPHSIIYGDPIVVDPAPDLPEAPGLAERTQALSFEKQAVPSILIKDWIGRELGKWREIRKLAQEYLLLLAANPEAPDVLEQGARTVQRFDDDNTSFMLQRYRNFSNRRFHRFFFNVEDSVKSEGLRYYFSSLSQMADELFNILLERFKTLNAREKERS